MSFFFSSTPAISSACAGLWTLPSASCTICPCQATGTCSSSSSARTGQKGVWPQRSSPNTEILVAADSIFQEPPCPINDLCACLALNSCQATCASPSGHTLGLSTASCLPPSSSFCNASRHLGLVTRFGHFGCQPVEHQGVCVTSLDNPTPLFPHNGCSLVRSKLASVLAVKSSLISFHIRPFGTGTKIDELFLLLHPRLSKVAQARLHVLDGFVVDSKEPMNRWVVHMVQLQR